MNIPYVFKRCSKCGKWLVASKVNFSRKKGGKYGLTSRCKKCVNKLTKQWCKNNTEKARESCKQWYENNKGKKAQYAKQYRENNKEKNKRTAETIL